MCSAHSFALGVCRRATRSSRQFKSTYLKRRENGREVPVSDQAGPITCKRGCAARRLHSYISPGNRVVRDECTGISDFAGCRHSRSRIDGMPAHARTPPPMAPWHISAAHAVGRCGCAPPFDRAIRKQPRSEALAARFRTEAFFGSAELVARETVQAANCQIGGVLDRHDG
jgi:hypothetical protein